MKIEFNDVVVDAEIIGGFKIGEKEYAVCSYADSNENYKIVISEIVRDNGVIMTKNIPNEEMDLVLETYRKIEDKLLGGDNNG